MILAVTGGTGFVGRRLLRLAAKHGHSVRALARSPQAPCPGVEWVPGDLASLPAALFTGADAVIHVGGVINARRSADFTDANVEGTRRVLAAAGLAGVRRFVHVSSLAAREPHLSRYGRSKSESETVVGESRLDWSIVRPPAVYGPGDRETFELFKFASRGLSLVPWDGRASYIHADDLCAALLALASASAPFATFEPDDGKPGGYGHAEFARLIGDAVGRPQRVIHVPDTAMLAAAAVSALLGTFSPTPPKLSLDRARYFAHPDWVSRGPAIPGWTPQIDAVSGLAATAAWYREAGWL